MKHQYSIFISYRHADTADKAEHLLTLLEAEGYKGRVSFDRENLDGQFDLEILQRLDNCTDFIVILGENTLNGIKDEDTIWIDLNTRNLFYSVTVYPLLANIHPCQVQFVLRAPLT